MYARVASFEGGDPDRIREEGNRRLGEGERPEGLLGYLVLADDAAKRRQFVTFFDSREAVEAGDRFFDKMGDEIPEDIRGRRTSVEIYEVVAHEWATGGAR